MPWDGVGGTEQAALRIAHAAADEGFDTVFFCLGRAAVVRDFFDSAGFETATWRAAYPEFNGYRFFLHDSMQLAGEFRRRGIDLVHCADVPAGAYAAFAGRSALAPVICHVRNRHASIGVPEQRMLRAVNTFAFVSRSTWAAFGHHVPARRGVILYDGIDVSGGGSTTDDRRARQDVRREFNVPDDTALVGMIARVDPQKDYETLARAARRLVDAALKVRFLIVGGYSVEAGQRTHFDQVQRWLAAHNVTAQFTFTDFRADVPRLLQAMDAVVLSTHYEGLPLVLLEAMARGKPVVATAVDGVPEVITSDRVGLLFPQGDDALLAAHLASLIRDPARAAQLGRSGREFVETHFSRDQFRRSVVELYRNVLHRNRVSAAMQPNWRPVAGFACKLGFAALDASIRR
jgi:glycosyltransferase involved in cell wall biosynthesis